jgi:hypothetical protein
MEMLRHKITENGRRDKKIDDGGGGGWVQCGEVGRLVQAKTFGYTNLLALLRDYPQHFEVRVGERDDESSYYVRCCAPGADTGVGT